MVFSLCVNPVVGQEIAHDFTLVDIDGNSFTLSKCPAKIVLIDFFATWCIPCVEEISVLRRLYSEYPRHQLQMISISAENGAILRDLLLDEEEISQASDSGLGQRNGTERR